MFFLVFSLEACTSFCVRPGGNRVKQEAGAVEEDEEITVARGIMSSGGWGRWFGGDVLDCELLRGWLAGMKFVLERILGVLWILVVNRDARERDNTIFLLVLSHSSKFLKISILSWSCQSIWKIILSCLEILDHIGDTQTCDKKQVDCLKN